MGDVKAWYSLYILHEELLKTRLRLLTYLEGEDVTVWNRDGLVCAAGLEEEVCQVFVKGLRGDIAMFASFVLRITISHGITITKKRYHLPR